MDEIKRDLNRLHDRLDSIDKTLVRQEENLKEHMRRTELLELEVHPIKEHVHQLRGAFKVLGLILTITGVVAALIKGM